MPERQREIYMESWAEVMQGLENSVGQDVNVDIVGTAPNLITGALHNVTPFLHVAIRHKRGEDVEIPFIGTEAAIGSIVDVDGKLLYQNTVVNSQYPTRTPEEVKGIQRATFGNELPVDMSWAGQA